ncbi:MAG TPA: hypothetical protein VHO67_02445 [Polyangia bacterium]|nr:hypothetical protein [Polyangia bacterium]
MRSPIFRPLFTVAAVALSTWATACQRADSILLVEVAGDLKLMPAGFAVTVAPRALAPRTIRVAPQAGGAISLPASFTIQLPGNATGPVTLSIDALDATQNVIAQGTATQQNLNVGGQTIVAVTLIAPGSISVTTPPDGGTTGVDAHPGVDARPTSDGHPNDGPPSGVDARDARADAPSEDAAADGHEAAGGIGGGGGGPGGAGGQS